MGAVSTDPADRLQPGESIVWAGRPSRYGVLRATDVVVVPLSIFWCWVAFPFISFDVQRGGLALVAFDTPFALIGAYLLVGRFVLRAVALGQARYLVTDRRLILTGGLRGRAAVAADLALLPEPVILQKSGGSGDLAFGKFPSVFDRRNPRRRPFMVSKFDKTAMYRFMMMFGYDPLVPPRMRAIPDVADVAQLIAHTQAAAPAAS
jgi:hypothetical protein